MKDPLHWMSVKHKLGLLFAGVCILAFGVGGFLVSSTARAVLEEEIRGRLVFHARVSARALDREMGLLTRRAEDFASDGLIRTALVRLRELDDGPERGGVAAELRDHLRENKIPLVGAFTNLTLLDQDGREVPGTSLDGAPSPPLGGTLPSAGVGAAYSPFLPGGGDGAEPLVAVVVPLTELRGGRRLGYLAAWIRPSEWMARALQGMTWPDPEAAQTVLLSVEDAAGCRVEAPPSIFREEERMAETAPGPGASAARTAPRMGSPETPFTAHHRLETTGWEMHLSLMAPGAFARVESLQSRFLALGILLTAAASFFLFFPMHFLVRPIVQLRDAAMRIRAGDFGARVEVGTADEIGDLARSFNHMAEAVEERTERLKATAESLRARQVELRAEKDRIAAVVSSMRDGVLVLDANGAVVFSNAAAGPLLDDLRSTEEQVTSHYDCRDAGENGARCGACLLRPDAPPRSCLLDARGRTLEIHATLLPPDRDGRRGRVLVARDITGRLRQDEVQIHQERLSALGEVAAVMAHELNNPLTSISMFAQMIGEQLPGDSPLREHVDVIRRNTDTCKRAIGDLLGYAAASSPEPGPVDLHAVLDDVRRFVRPVSDRCGARVVVEEGPDEAVVRGDEIQLRQLFVNLAINACQAGGRGCTVTLATSREEDVLTVEVRDDGPGIAEGIRSRIFDPFYTTKPREEGTGLGLPTARRIAELHGGSVELRASEPGCTVFSVRLRLDPEKERALARGTVPAGEMTT